MGQTKERIQRIWPVIWGWVFHANALYQLGAETNDAEDREHVSYGFCRSESGNRWNEDIDVWRLAHEEVYQILQTLRYARDETRPLH